MKILMLTDRMDVGGAETHIAELALGLMRLGVTVEIASGGGKASDELGSAGILQHRMPFFSHNPIRLLICRRRLRALIRESGYDLIHAHARIPALLLRGLRTGVPRVVTVHAKFYSNRILRRLCYWGDRTVAVSEDLRAYVCDTYGVSGERVRVIHNGIDCRKFSPSPKKEKQNALRVLFASRLDEDCAMGAELLCQIAPALCRAHPTMEISIAGGGDASPRIRHLAEHANRVLGKEAIRMLGSVSDMPALLREQDIFVGVSRAAMEAAACGCAVILCGNEGYLGILDPSRHREAVLSNFCCRNGDKPYAPRLECDLRLLSDRDTRRRVAQGAMELIRTAFNAERMCEKTLALYRRLIHPPYRKKLLVGGYFGCGNAGDDAILLGFLEGLHDVAPDVQVQALTADPARAEGRFGIRCVNRKNPFAVRFVMRHADMFICGGGSLLQNVTSQRSLRYYLTLLRMAKRARCKTVLYAAGIGPIRGTCAQKSLQRVLSDCDYISLRDPDSMRFLQKLGVDHALLHEGADPALLTPTPPLTRAAAILGVYPKVLEKRRLCVVLRRTPSGTEHLWQSVATATKIICQRHGLAPLFLCFSDEDKEPTYAVCHSLGVPFVSVREVGDLAALIRDSIGVLSMRLHALVLAAASSTPAIGIATDPTDGKIAAFSRLVGQELVVYPRPSVGELVDAAEAFFSSSPTQKSNLTASAVDDLRKKARKDLANIAEMLYNNEDSTRTGP